MSKQWIIEIASPDREALASRWGVPPVVAQLLVNRGVTPGSHGDSFLSPQLKDLHPPSTLPGALGAADVVVGAIRNGKKIVLYGDYDVDGTTGVAILWHVLKLVGADVSFYVPHRVSEGYGLSVGAVRRLVEDGAELVISIDCGIRAVEVAKELSELGVSFIVTDHHQEGAALPDASVIVHPTAIGESPNIDLCGAGVAFKLAWAIAQKWSNADRVSPEFRELLRHLLPLAALGTIADVVSLVGENRIIARHGLAALASCPIPGVQALIESAGLDRSRVSGHDVGFKIAPRINAAGRMGHARLAVELLTRADTARAREIALYLEGHNRSRQSTERKISKQAREMIDGCGLAGDARRGIVLAGEGWHAGVIGIVAARLVDRYHRPTVLFAMNGDEGQGSARSIKHFDLAEAFSACSDHLLGHGGHAMAAGCRIRANELPAFTEAFVDLANRRLTHTDMIPKLRLDAQVQLAEMTLATAEAIVGLGPFGTGNPKPKLATDWVELADEPRRVGRSQEHLQVSFRQNGTRIRGIGFGQAANFENIKEHRRCRVAFEPIVNDYRGRREVQMQIIDMQFPK